MLRSLLIPLDLSPASERVMARAALLPLARDAQVTLLHVVPRWMPRDARARAERDAQAALDARGKTLARSLPKGVRVRRVVASGGSATEIAKQARAVKAELIVMGCGSGRALRDAFLGTTAERVVREAQRPVLVVRLRARAGYHRPLLAIDLDDAAPAVLETMLRVIAPPRPTVAVVHVYDAPFSGVYPSVAADEVTDYAEHYRRKALRGIQRLLTTTLADLQHVAPAQGGAQFKIELRKGAARTVIEQAAKRTNADLLVLGTHARSGPAQAFLGTVAGDVLREVRCDVLVVPPRRRA